MSSYQIIDTGKTTTKDDPRRGIWYGANGKCGYWTDDWDKLGRAPGGVIPTCPKCGCVGMQTEASKWFAGAKKFESDGHPRYAEFLPTSKEQCAGGRKGFLDRYAEWIAAEKAANSAPLEAAEIACAELARKIAKGCPDGWGFGLFLFRTDAGKAGLGTWASNCDRRDVILALRKWLATNPEERMEDNV